MKQKPTDYENRLAGLTDAELLKECESKIWLSAYAANNPASAYHSECDACYAECVTRNASEIYALAHKKASR